jgi:hypothetical protein
MPRKIRINYPMILVSMQPEDRIKILRCADQLEEKLGLSHRDSLELLAKIGAHLQNGKKSEKANLKDSR